MTTIKFEEDELTVIAMFATGSREGTLTSIGEIIPFIEDDAELQTVVKGTVEKMMQISDSEFARLDLEMYRQESVEDEN
ncbi:MAG: transposon-transfer assisting family protein [Lachnospiraceae bacterium]|nr:transposon-transfer assisting family protein [Lachnospiraceae bacterium]